jgi:diguanylate cyclase (GGDEF)-like protein
MRSLLRGTRVPARGPKLCVVSTASLPRRPLFATALGLYAIVFAAFWLFEVPGLGVAHFFYIPVALLALAGGTWLGLVGGGVATALYALAIFVTPRVPSGDVLTYATAIRFVNYTCCGLLVGWFADQHRHHLKELRELAERDFLTGILNTRVFDEALARRCSAGRPFLLLLADMDDLKLINDTHGHTAGNNELRRLAQALTTALEPGDELARVGGDEFAVLTDASAGEAVELCRTFRARLAAQNLHMTFGWAALDHDGVAPLELFRKADDRLYAAKLIGRNHRVVRQAVGAQQ